MKNGWGAKDDEKQTVLDCDGLAPFVVLQIASYNG